jgi:protein-S-isoprenylcysteine O-methyltransferase Ste14
MKSLILRSIAGLAFLLTVLGIVLFVSAGTLDYWQAWLYLAIFGGSVLLITLDLIRHDRHLLESRLSVGAAQEQRTSQKIIQAFASLSFVALYIVSGLDRRFGWSRVPAVVVLMAEVIVALGFYFVYRVFKENSFTSALIEVQAEQHVITTGPYAVVRHPMYAGALLMMAATPVALGSWVALPFLLPLVAVIVARLLDEEKLLAQELPGYEAYRQRVPHRLVPRVW